MSKLAALLRRWLHRDDPLAWVPHINSVVWAHVDEATRPGRLR